MAPRDPDPNGEAKERAERRLARVMARYFAEQRRSLRQIISRQMAVPLQPGGLFWDSEERRLVPVLREHLAAMAQDGAERELNQIFRRKQIDLDPSVIIRLAVEWAVGRAEEISSVITGTTKDGVRQALQNFFEVEGFTIGDVISDIEKLVANPVRSQAIAVTETTRAYARGQQIISEELRATGFETVEIWNTNNDGLVCPICEPRNQKEIQPGWEFPAHVNCRCWPTSQLVSS